VAAKVGRTEETVRRWIWSGRLPATKRGNVLYVEEADIPETDAPNQRPPSADGAKGGHRLTLAQWADRVRTWQRDTSPGTTSAADLVIEARWAERLGDAHDRG
jgi:hypothetical protein